MRSIKICSRFLVGIVLNSYQKKEVLRLRYGQEVFVNSRKNRPNEKLRILRCIRKKINKQMIK